MWYHSWGQVTDVYGNPVRRQRPFLTLDPPERTGEGQHSLATCPFSGSGASQSPQNQRESSWNSLARRRER